MSIRSTQPTCDLIFYIFRFHVLHSSMFFFSLLLKKEEEYKNYSKLIPTQGELGLGRGHKAGRVRRLRTLEVKRQH
jgi:hypothetical protein